MGNILRYTGTLWLLMAVFLPSAIRLVHHHQSFAKVNNGEVTLSDFREQCPACAFEFSVFSAGDTLVLSKALPPVTGYYNRFSAVQPKTQCNYKFNLRAPPTLVV